MPILYGLDDAGGFAVGDTDSGFASYAYPTSPHADAARTDPERVAAEMHKQAAEGAWMREAGAPAAEQIAQSDARMIARLEAGRSDGSTKELPSPLPARDPMADLMRALDGEASCLPGYIIDPEAGFDPNPEHAVISRQLGEGIGGQVIDWPEQPDTYHGQRDERADQHRPIEPAARLLAALRTGWADQGATVTNYASQERGGLEPGDRVFLAPRSAGRER